ncbi:hypothetical protein C1H46_008511 [Malus baccata]|uniref:Glycosyltransferase family 92 protein n=1 Tax=Malus baccata TaxID=106549 RepID=A0A540N445_MALBA|nr:hypothetical protein C1H46_008511 [Malus baccata]
MAGLYSSSRPTSSSSSSSSFASSSSFQTFASRLLLLLTVLPLTLAAFAFVLQWRGGLNDPVTRWSPDSHEFPGMVGMVQTGGPQRQALHSSGSDCVDVLGRSHSPAFPYYKDWKFDYASDLRPKISIQTSTSAGLEQTLPWIFYHKVIGVTNFFLFVEGKAASPKVSKVLETIPGVKVIYRTKELEEQQAKRLESSVEHDDIKEPFSEVSMFKKNYDHLPKDVYFGNYKEATRGNPNYFLTYGNGKSAARIQDHLRPNGAHRWHNYMKTPNEIKLDEAAVLHYTYPKFSDLTSRRDRCGCKPTKDDVKRCFMLEFDRAAFIIASTATEEEMLSCFCLVTIVTPLLQRKGFLPTRNCWKSLRVGCKVIIQGLRESGVFSSVIASAAQTNLSKDQFLSSVESSNSSRESTSGAITSRKIGKLIDSQATARRVLEFTDDASHPLAVPPLSPPGLDEDDFQIDVQLSSESQ